MTKSSQHIKDAYISKKVKEEYKINMATPKRLHWWKKDH
jgi:hypothetical protein